VEDQSAPIPEEIMSALGGIIPATPSEKGGANLNVRPAVWEWKQDVIEKAWKG